MMREIGVQGVEVEDLYALDDECFASLRYVYRCVNIIYNIDRHDGDGDDVWWSYGALPSSYRRSVPVYGLIFLFKWVGGEAPKQNITNNPNVYFLSQVRYMVEHDDDWTMLRYHP